MVTRRVHDSRWENKFRQDVCASPPIIWEHPKLEYCRHLAVSTRESKRSKYTSVHEAVQDVSTEGSTNFNPRVFMAKTVKCKEL